MPSLLLSSACTCALALSGLAHARELAQTFKVGGVTVNVKKGTFTVDDVTGSFQDPEDPAATQGKAVKVPDIVFEGDPDASTSVTDSDSDGGATDSIELFRQSFSKKYSMMRMCGCTNDKFDFTPEVADIRSVSDSFMANGDAGSSKGFTNAVWAWGQFLDHDLVATVDLDDPSPSFDIKLTDGGRTATMTLHRLDSDADGKCRAPKVVNTPQLDAGTVYGSDEGYLQAVLRKPGSCKLRMSDGNLLPVTTQADSTQRHFLLAGDPRVNEHAVLTSMHTLWMREHNRICDELDGPQYFGFSSDEKFELARHVVIAKIQQITVAEFLPALGLSQQKIRTHKPMANKPDMSAEFAVAAYRFGHDLIPDKMGKWTTRNIFDGEAFFNIQSAAGANSPAKANADMDSLLGTITKTSANEIDGKLSDTLRNTLFGEFGEDLGSRNIFRGRELGMSTYMQLGECFGTNPDAEVGAETDDPFLGMLREKNTGGSVLGRTMDAILTDQFHRVLFGKGGDWWENRQGDVLGFQGEILSTSLSKVIKANTGAKVSGNAFKKGK